MGCDGIVGESSRRRGIGRLVGKLGVVRGVDVGVIGRSRCWEDWVIGSKRGRGLGYKMGAGVKEVRCG